MKLRVECYSEQTADERRYVFNWMTATIWFKGAVRVFAESGACE